MGAEQHTGASAGNVLVITHSFPPNSDIGARRWFKITKYLARQHKGVYVLTTDIKAKDLVKTNEQVWVKTIKRNYPDIVFDSIYAPQKKLWRKIYFKLTLMWMRLFVKGTLFDMGIFMKRKITKAALQMIAQHNIKVVVVTGAPFSYLRYAVKLKQKIPGLKVICDIRDPWTNGKYYGFSGISPARLKVEKEYERMVMQEADVILTPNQSMTARFKNDYAHLTSPEKFKVLPHPYDPDEIGEVSTTPKHTTGLRIITGGTIDLDEIEKTFEPFLKSLEVLQQQNVELYQHTSVTLYTQTSRLTPLLKQYAHLPVTLKEKISATEFFNHLKEADFLLVFLPPYVKDYMITKLTEYLALKKPILLFSPKGMVADFIVNNQLGVWMDTENEKTVADFPARIRAYLGPHSAFNRQFDSAQFGGPQVAAQLMSYFV